MSLKTLAAFVWLFSTVCFEMSPQMACLRRYKVALIAFVFTFHHCELSYVSSNCMPERMQSHTGCTCLPFLHCAFSNVSSNYLPERLQSQMLKAHLKIHNKKYYWKHCFKRLVTFVETCFLQKFIWKSTTRNITESSST